MNTVMERVINRKKNGKRKELNVFPKLKPLIEVDMCSHNDKEFSIFKNIIFKLCDNNIGSKIDKHIKERDIRGSLKAKIYKRKYGNKIPFPEQGISIALGTLIEKAVKEYIKNKAKILGGRIIITDIDGQKKSQDIDIYFIFNGVVYGLELKSNLRLDTGKARDTIRQIKNIEKYFSNKYDDYKCGIISLSAPTQYTIPRKECSTIFFTYRNFLYGYQDFFALFGVSFNEFEWDNLIYNLYINIEKSFYDYMSGKPLFGGI